MDYRVIFVLLVKTAGLFLFLYGVVLTPDKVAGYLLQPERSTALAIGLVILPIVVPLITGMALLFFPASITRAVVGPTFASEGELGRWIQPILFSGLGLYFTVRGLEDLVYYVTFRAHAETAYDANMFDSPETYAGFVSSTFSVVAGVALLLGARGLSGVLQRLRSGS